MNKKEFEEKYVVDFDGWKRMKTAVAPDELWQWIEQQIKEARVDENEYWIDIIKKHGTWSQTSMGFTINDFADRIKGLNET